MAMGSRNFALTESILTTPKLKKYYLKLVNLGCPSIQSLLVSINNIPLSKLNHTLTIVQPNLYRFVPTVEIEEQLTIKMPIADNEQNNQQQQNKHKQSVNLDKKEYIRYILRKPEAELTTQEKIEKMSHIGHQTIRLLSELLVELAVDQENLKIAASTLNRRTSGLQVFGQ